MLSNYKESTDWLFAQFPSYQNLGASAYKPGLENTRSTLRLFGNPEKEMKFIHVAGTNGKGSTCAFIASFLAQKGYKTGLFTSPHLIDFRERIRINGKAISEEKVIVFVNEIKSKNLELSFFEITLAMALVHFQEAECDYVVLETGMGGRLDATNVVNPILSIITNIGIDHQTFLGDTLEQISLEKAGIIKNNVPVICGEERPALQSIFNQKARYMDAPIHFCTNPIEDRDNILPAYQRKNVAIALEAMNILGMETQSINIKHTWLTLFQKTGFIGRLFPSTQYPKLWYDASHNAEGFKTTMDALHARNINNPIIIFGASNDKSLAHLSSFNPLINAWYFCEFSNPRSMRTEEFGMVSESINLKNVKHFTDVNQAIEMAIAVRSEEQAILVTGSFFLLSDCNEIKSTLKDQLTQ